MSSIYLRNEKKNSQSHKKFCFAITNTNSTYMLDMSDIRQFVKQVTREI